MKFSTITSKVADGQKIKFARDSNDCMWFDSFGVLCRFSDTARNYEQRFVSLSLEELNATNWRILKP